jgi:hypothetical protein
VRPALRRQWEATLSDRPLQGALGGVSVAGDTQQRLYRHVAVRKRLGLVTLECLWA